MEGKVFDAIKYAAGMLGLALTWLFGPFDMLLQVLVTFIIIDYITGVTNALKTKTLSSEIGFNSLIKKVAIMALVAVAALLDKLMPEANGALRATVSCFYIANEGISIMENISRLGLPLPKALRSALLQLKKDEGGDADEEDNK